MKKQRTNHNTDGIVNCLLQPGHIRNQLHKSMPQTLIHLLNFVYHDSSYYRDKVSRAAGRRAVVMVFALPSGQFYCNMTNSANLSGPRHLDNLIVTPNSRPLIGTLPAFVKTTAFKAKTHANPDTPPSSGQAHGN